MLNVTKGLPVLNSIQNVPGQMRNDSGLEMITIRNN